MNCDSCKTYLIEYLEGSMPEQENHKIMVHLQECTTCREFAEYLSQSLSTIESSKITIPDPFFYTRISVRKQSEEIPPAEKNKIIRILQPAVFSFLVIAAIFAGIRIGSFYHSLKTDNYAVENLDPWVNEINSEPLETFLMDNL